MGKAHKHEAVLLVIAAFSRHEEALLWAKDKASQCWGKLSLESEIFSFVETSYYQSDMGSELRLQLFAFEKLISPTSLVEIKLSTNTMESTYAKSSKYPETRPLNLDPGYLTPNKFVLASTKDAAHRLYLGEGIFGEATLCYIGGAWQHRDWTYANYRKEEYKNFLDSCKTFYLQKRRDG